MTTDASSAVTSGDTTLLACPICASHRRSDYTTIGVASQGRGGVRRYEVLRCRGHGVAFADALPPPAPPRAAKASLDAVYGRLSREPAGASPRYTCFMDRVERVVSPPGILHDVGCGNGQLLLEARRRGWTVQGNDIVAEVSSDLEALGIDCYIGALHELALPPCSCDVVTSFCVLPHHLADPLPDLDAVAAMLKPGGWFVLELPDDGVYRRSAHLLYRLSGGRARWLLSNLYGPGGHQFAYTRRNIGLLLERCSLRVARIEPYDVSPRWSLARYRTGPLPLRVVGTAAVFLLYAATRVLRRPNHMVVYARRVSG